MSKPYYIYVLYCADQTLYCGFTDDVKKRVATHQAGRAPSTPGLKNATP